MSVEAYRHIGTRLAFRTIGRAMRYSFMYKYEMAVKAATAMTGIFWILFLPWPGKIVIDYIVVPDKARDQDAVIPFFMRPLLAAVEPLTPYQTAWVMGTLFLIMILLVGAFGSDRTERDRAVAGLAEGEDTATRSENQANVMSSMVSGFFGLFEAVWQLRITHRLNHFLRSELFKRFQAHRITDFHNQAIGDVVYRAMYDTPSISNVVFNIWVGPATTIVNLATTILMMFVVYRAETTVVWVALAVAPLSFVMVLWLPSLTRKYGTLAREAGAATTSVIEEGMSNVLAMQGLGNDANDFARFAEASEFSFRRFRSVVLLSIIGGYITTLISVSLVFVVFFVCSDSFIAGTLAPGDFWVIWMYYNAIAASSSFLGRLWLNLQENITGLNRVFTVLDEPIEELDAVERGTLTSGLVMREGITLEGVDYDYPDGTPALRGIDFEGHLGELIALTGPTGAGKSTLAYIVPGLLTPTRGRFTLDGRQMSDADLAPLRRQVAFVFQETSMFDATIEDNILMGRRGASMQDVREAARQAGAAEFIERLPQRYQTRLGRAGAARLSMGQKQRIAIARALISNKPVLILDEPTAALDPQTENELVANLRAAREGRLVIIIAHRLSTIRSADRIYFLEEGRVIESGTHGELMALRGTYAEFVNLQAQRSENLDE